MPVFRVQSPIGVGESFPLSPSDLQHLKRSLRLKKGDRFDILFSDGQKGKATLSFENGEYRGVVENIALTNPSHPLPLSIGIGMIRWSRMEWLVEKATELGVKQITPLLLSRSRFKNSKDKFASKINRLKKIAEESLKQCERVCAPEVHPSKTLEEWLRSVSLPNSQKILFNESGLGRLLTTNLFKKDCHQIFLIGPEGGFTPDEIALAEGEGFQSVSLGSTKLRSETAALYGITLLDSFLKESS